MSDNVTTEATTEVEKDSQASQESQETGNRNLLFGTISYTDDLAYENFLKTMNVNQAVFILIASANFAQVKGAFNLLESEVLANAIRVIKKTSTSETAAESDPAATSTNS